MASKKTKPPVPKAKFKRSRADPGGLHPAARVRAELTLSGAFRIPPTKPVKKNPPKDKTETPQKAGKKSRTKSGRKTKDPKKDEKPALVESSVTSVTSVESTEAHSKDEADKIAEFEAKEKDRLNKARLEFLQLVNSPTSKSFGGLKVECPVMLVHQDEDVLIALLAFAALSARRTIHKANSVYRECLEEENPGDSAVSIDVLRSDLVDLLGWSRNSKTYEALFHSLARLTSTRITWNENYMSPEGDAPIRESKLIGFYECPWTLPDLKSPWVPSWSIGAHSSKAEIPQDGILTHQASEADKVTKEVEPHLDGDVDIPQPKRDVDNPQNTQTHQPIWSVAKKPSTVVICSYLTAPVLEAKTNEKFGLHWTEERSSLGPSARCLYSQLAAMVWPGSTIKTSWDDLVKRLFARTPNDRLRGITTRLLKTMPAGWSFDMQGTGKRSILVVTRPAIKRPKIMNVNV
jgi:hypothetical protein